MFQAPNQANITNDTAFYHNPTLSPIFNVNLNQFSPYPDVFDINFLQKFEFSPGLAIKESGGSKMGQLTSNREAIPFQNLKTISHLWTSLCNMSNKDGMDRGHPATNQGLKKGVT